MRKIERLSWRQKEGLTRYILPIHDKATINGVTYGRAIMHCPVCFEQRLSLNGPGPYYRWKHGDSNCGGNLYIGDDAHLLCGKCGQHIPILEGSFLCPVHGNAGDACFFFNNQSPNKSAISIIGGIMTFATLLSIGPLSHKMGVGWLRKFLTSLESL